MTVRLIPLKTIADAKRGTLAVAEFGADVPFDVRRAFYMYGIPKGAERGHHAHRAQHQFLIAMHGKLQVESRDRAGDEVFTLDHPGIGLHAPPLTWLVVRALTDDATCLVLVSEHFDEADYIRDRAEFETLSRM